MWEGEKKTTMRIREWKEEDLRKRKDKGRDEDRKGGERMGK